MNPSGINWVFFAPQFHVAISAVALLCLGLNISMWSQLRKIVKRTNPDPDFRNWIG